MVKIKEIRKKAAERLETAGNDSPLADTDYILKHIGFSKNDILMGDKELDKTRENVFWQAIRRVELGEPVQYVTGNCEFMSLNFEVNSATLIPRSDTEILVETVIEHCKDKKDINILEIGSGSGCIAVSLAKFLPNANVVSVDISSDALNVAQRNAASNGVEDRVKFIKHDILTGFPTPRMIWDVIVSNPPYIPSGDIDGLDKKVKFFEPLSALDGGADGLDFYRFISKSASLSKGGVLAFEVGINQAKAVADMLSERFCDIKIAKDLSGIDRVVLGIIK
ncbi:MAG: peptide chain release factor N(5)-glutamine methyltransferase [Clostridia bacterium]|nr:peptide chain release factor N(5)-glutamine methyltransferase [Clostridia bacterium]